jgi:hypothetical protein
MESTEMQKKCERWLHWNQPVAKSNDCLGLLLIDPYCRFVKKKQRGTVATVPQPKT